MNDPTVEPDFPTITKEVTISETLSKTIPIEVEHYFLNGIYKNEDGNAEIDADFSDTNWLTEYERENYTLEDLLKVCKEFLEKVYISDVELQKSLIKQAKFIAKQLSGWQQDDIEVIPE